MYRDDAQVIGDVLRGDKDQYAELVQRYKRMVYGIAWSRLGNVELSEDAAQETFVKAYRYLGALRDPNKFAGWVARIARNVCTSFGRRARRECEFVEQWQLESPVQQAAEDNRESLEEQLKHSFATLPVIHREALTVFYLEGKSVRESAEMLGISENALKARLFRARTALREQLERRLANTLETLEPSKDFTPSVLGLLPLSPKGAAVGSGGVLAVLGKLSASFSFFLWTGLASSALSSVLWFWYFKAEEANIREDYAGREVLKRMLWRTARITIIAMAGAMFIATLAVSRFDYHAVMKVIAVYWAYFGWRMSRILRVDNSPYMINEMFSIVVMLGMITAIGFFNAPMITFPITMMVFSVIGFFTAGFQPTPAAYAFATSVPIETLVTEQPQVHMSREDLRTFARLLGREKLVMDYRFEGDSIVLILPHTRPTLWSQLSKCVTTGSTAVVTPDGGCEVHRSPADVKGLRQLAADTQQDADILLDMMDQQIPSRLRAFIANGCRPASPEMVISTEGVLKQPPGKLWHRRAIFVFCFVVCAWLLHGMLPST